MAKKSSMGITIASLLLTGYLLFKSVLGMADPLPPEQMLSQRLNNKPVLTKVEHEQRRKYAVIVNGSSDAYFKKNVTIAHECLNAKGFYDENIFLVASENNFRKVFNYLETIADNNDLLVIYTTGHGDRKGDQSTLCLTDKKQITASDLNDLVSMVKARDKVIVADQCFSGGIVQTLSGLDGRIIAFSSTDAEHPTKGVFFGRYFWNSFRTGKADTNKNGVTSLDEAFNYASQEYNRIDSWSRLQDRLSDATRNCQAYHSTDYPKEL